METLPEVRQEPRARMGTSVSQASVLQGICSCATRRRNGYIREVGNGDETEQRTTTPAFPGQTPAPRERHATLPLTDAH